MNMDGSDASRGAYLNYFQVHVVVIPIAISTTYNGRCFLFYGLLIGLSILTQTGSQNFSEIRPDMNNNTRETVTTTRGKMKNESLVDFEDKCVMINSQEKHAAPAS